MFNEIEKQIYDILDNREIRGLVYCLNDKVYIYVLDTQIDLVREQFEYIFNDIFKVYSSISVNIEAVLTPKNIKINIELGFKNEQRKQKKT